MTFQDLEDEYRTVLIGNRIYQRIRLRTQTFLRRRDPTVYARGAHDYRDALGDVVNDFVLDVLIRERQIDYVMATASDLSSFDRLINRQLRRYLARTRRRTIVDNLIDRALLVLHSPPFDGLGSEDGERFFLPGPAGPPANEASDAGLRHAAALAQAVPKIRGEGDQRAPKVYDAKGLQAVLVLLCKNASGLISRQGLQSFFEYLLTAWTPSLLELTEEHGGPGRDLTPSEETMVRDTASEITSGMADEERLIFQYKFANLADRQLASALSLSRPTAAARKQALYDRLVTELADVDPPLRQAVLARMNEQIALGGVDAP